MNASIDKPIETFQLFKTAIDRSGKSFDNFTNAEKRALAEITKMDVDEMNKLFKLDLRTGINELNRMMKEEQDMKKAAEEASTALEKLTKIFYIFVGYLTPVIKEVHRVIDGFHKWIQANKETAKNLGLVLTVAAALTLGLTLLAKAYVFLVAIVMSTRSLLGGKSAVDVIARCWFWSKFRARTFGETRTSCNKQC